MWWSPDGVQYSFIGAACYHDLLCGLITLCLYINADVWYWDIGALVIIFGGVHLLFNILSLVLFAQAVYIAVRIRSLLSCLRTAGTGILELDCDSITYWLTSLVYPVSGGTCLIDRNCGFCCLMLWTSSYQSAWEFGAML